MFVSHSLGTQVFMTAGKNTMEEVNMQPLPPVEDLCCDVCHGGAIDSFHEFNRLISISILFFSQFCSVFFFFFFIFPFMSH
jgi:hypothetical protein